MNKTIKTCLAILTITGIIALGGLARGQTNTATNNPFGPVTGFWKFAQDVGSFFVDSQPYFTNRSINPTVGGLYVDGHWGGFVSLSLPIDSTGQVSMGFAAAYLGNSPYDASLSIKLGTTWNQNGTVPWIGPVYTYAGTGPGYNFHTKSAVVHSELGGIKKWTIGPGDLYFTAGAIQISDLSGWGGYGGGGYTIRF